MGDGSATQARARLEALLADIGPDVLPTCGGHGAVAAEAVCDVCGGFFCWDCVTLDPDRLVFLCEACRRAVAAESRGLNVAAWLRLPFFYVGIAACVAVLAYLAGVGHPTVASLAAADAREPWYRQRVGRLWLRQARRARSRATVLAGKQRVQAAAAWAGLAQRALSQAARCWADTEAMPELRIGAAVMAARAGNAATAYDLLNAAAGALAPEHPAWPSYLYHRGRLAFATGATAPGRADWTALLAFLAAPGRDTGRALDTLIDRLVEVYSKDRMVAVARGEIAAVCETDLPVAFLRREVTAGLEARGIPVPPGMRPNPADSPWPTTPATNQDEPKTKLVVRHRGSR